MSPGRPVLGAAVLAALILAGVPAQAASRLLLVAPDATVTLEQNLSCASQASIRVTSRSPELFG